MASFWKPIAATVIILLCLQCALSGQRQPPSGDAENGKRLYVQNGCYECHGYVGQGSVDGVRLAPWTLPAQALIRYVRHPSGQMPPYTEKAMTDEELIDVTAYLKAIHGPKAAKDTPLLSHAGSN